MSCLKRRIEASGGSGNARISTALAGPSGSPQIAAGALDGGSGSGSLDGVPHRPRPPQLPDRAGRPRRTAELRSIGISARELTGPLWARVAHGLHVPVDAGLARPLDRILAAAELLPAGAAIGGWAALHLLGATDLDGRDGSRLLPVPVCLNPSGRIRPREFLRIDRRRLPEEDIAEVNGIAVTNALRSCSDIACDRGVELGVVAGDAAARFGLLTAAQLRAYVAGRPRTTGLAWSRRAAALVSDRTKSSPESVLRYIWVVEAGLPLPLVNVPIFALPEGYVMAEADLLDPVAAVVAESDGAQHREPEQHTFDNNREEWLELRNLVVARATALDLWPRRRALVSRLRQRHAQGMARDRSRDAWSHGRAG